MSLKHFQRAWAQRGLGYEVDTTGLDALEKRALEELPEHKHRSMQRATQHGRSSIFVAATPARVQAFFTPEELKHLAQEFAHAYPEATLYPLSENMPAWLAFIVHAKGAEHPHLGDIIFYEAAAIQAQYYGFPTALSGCQISPAAKLFVAGPYFTTVLENLELRDDYVDTPKQGYVYVAHAFQSKIYPLHWTLYETLSHVYQSETWLQAVERFLGEHPEVAPQKQALLEWEATLQQWKILL